MNPTLRKATENDFEFAFLTKKDALGPYISTKWGWDEDFQRNLHAQRWSEKPWFIISLNNSDIGTLSLHTLDMSTLRFGEFYISKEFRNKGLGTKILKQVLNQCDSNNQNVILEYLKWNPVGDLYKRHAFVIKSENEIHYFMERKANFCY